MFAPTKTWRKWHVKVSVNQRRFATVSALAASALPSLVLARGHRIENIAEVPLVIPASSEEIVKTKEAVALLKSLGAYEDVIKVSNSRKLRAGVGKMRNRRHVQRRGPLVVYETEGSAIAKAFRNLPGVEVVNVHRYAHLCIICHKPELIHPKLASTFSNSHQEDILVDLSSGQKAHSELSIPYSEAQRSLQFSRVDTCTTPLPAL